jgi:hypothetical protein
MPENDAFMDLIRRVRGGDEQAAIQLVRDYEPVIRLEVRLRLVDPRLRRFFDSMDVCQSVLASFFVRAASGQYDLDRPENLVKLLVVMARKKVALEARKERAQRRDHRRIQALGVGAAEALASDPSPSRMVAGKELLQAFKDRLSAEERQLADLRALGQEWAAIATQVGGTPEGRRKQLARALDRVARQLGLDHDHA